MKYNENTIKDILLIVGLSILVFVINLVDIRMPILFFISIIISIIIFAILTVKYKEKLSIIIGINILLILLLSGMIFIYAIIKFVMFSIVGISIGFSIRNYYNFKKTLIFGVVANIIGFIISYLVVLNFLKINVISDLYVNNILEFFKTFNLPNYSINDLIVSLNNLTPNEYLDKMISFDPWWIILFVFELFVFVSFLGGSSLNGIFVIIPSFILIVAIISTYFAIKIVVGISSKKHENNIEAFSNFKLSNGYGIAFIIVQLLLWGGNFQYESVNVWNALLINMMLVLNFGFMAQGLSLIDFQIKKTVVKTGIRILLYLVLGIFLFSAIIIIGLIILGVFDYLFNFRKLETN